MQRPEIDMHDAEDHLVDVAELGREVAEDPGDEVVRPIWSVHAEFVVVADALGYDGADVLEEVVPDGAVGGEVLSDETGE